MLGLVCITASDQVRFKSITRTRLRALAPPLQTKTLRDLYGENIRRLSRAIDFCLARNIRLYRLTSALFPQSEEPPGYDVLG
ncbi:MAG TPA: UV damage endonuclease UvsE, partial [Thermoanaerobaculia bacterium]